MFCNVGFAQCIKGDCNNGYGTYTWTSGNKYVGKYKDGKQHGQGTLTFADGGKYIGQWEDGKLQGRGTLTLKNGSKLVGKWKDGKLHGRGTAIDANGSKYVGEWKDGKKHGRGTLTSTTGTKYVGEWKDDKRHGQGTYRWADGTIDKGIWKYGKLEWQIDFKYKKFLKGIWTINQPMDLFLNESKSGHNFVDEEMYMYKKWIGFANADHLCEILGTAHEFIPSKNLKKFGVKGTAFVVLQTNCKNNEGRFGFDNIFIANKGDLVLFQYSTDFEEQFFTFPFKIGGPSPYLNSFERDELKFVKINNVTREMDENKFLGQFKHKFWDLNKTEDALPECPGKDYVRWNNCYGKIVFPDGNEYVGEFYNGIVNGQGTWTWTDGSKYVGEFRNALAHGQGTRTFTNGDKYVGEYKEGNFHGQGTYTWADGTKYVGGWKDNEEHGQGTLTYFSRSKYVGEFKDGTFNGQGTYTYDDGDKYVGEFKDGKKHGQGTYTKTDGTIGKGIWEKDKLVEPN